MYLPSLAEASLGSLSSLARALRPFKGARAAGFHLQSSHQAPCFDRWEELAAYLRPPVGAIRARRIARQSLRLVAASLERLRPTAARVTGAGLRRLRLAAAQLGDAAGRLARAARRALGRHLTAADRWLHSTPSFWLLVTLACAFVVSLIAGYQAGRS